MKIIFYLHRMKEISCNYLFVWYFLNEVLEIDRDASSRCVLLLPCFAVTSSIPITNIYITSVLQTKLFRSF